ncbi:MAG: hypothetical protein BEU05_02620 [Marine Group III euryarchaeote CG-Bathy2]|uniref:Ceramidase n=1 Tax=Marine Group III euryarchaeote CG-Bathy2 TaxID=1889002 RepID=A0A1J5SLN9_9ARCH|nr:MAG: hypothetical protein BEU05_02620 [Marine Group III euryarchaeote CG-Bathy2]
MIDREYLRARREFCVGLAAVVAIFVAFVLAYVLNDASWGAESDSRIGEAARYCERITAGFIREPANTLSNIPFVLVGLWVLWRMQHDPVGGRPSLATRSWFTLMYGVACVAVGVGSFAMHGFNTGWGGWMDLTGMMLYITLPVFYNFSRFLGWDERQFLAGYLGTNAVLSALHWQYGIGLFVYGFAIAIWLAQETAIRYQQQPLAIFLVPIAGIIILVNYNPVDFVREQVGVIIFMALLAWFLYRLDEIRLQRTHTPYFWCGSAAYLLASFIWRASQQGGGMCEPDSLLQGHALWHILGAVAMFCFYRYFRTEVNNY